VWETLSPFQGFGLFRFSIIYNPVFPLEMCIYTCLRLVVPIAKAMGCMGCGVWEMGACVGLRYISIVYIVVFRVPIAKAMGCMGCGV